MSTKSGKGHFELVQAKGETLSGALWESYLQQCERRNLRPIAPRTYSMYVNRLRDLGLIEARRAKVKGKVRLLRVIREGKEQET